jgi:hypothetical protein
MRRVVTVARTQIQKVLRVIISSCESAEFQALNVQSRSISLEKSLSLPRHLFGVGHLQWSATFESVMQQMLMRYFYC